LAVGLTVPGAIQINQPQYIPEGRKVPQSLRDLFGLLFCFRKWLIGTCNDVLHLQMGFQHFYLLGFFLSWLKSIDKSRALEMAQGATGLFPLRVLYSPTPGIPAGTKNPQSSRLRLPPWSGVSSTRRLYTPIRFQLSIA
jgi:hypothetical protein